MNYRIQNEVTIPVRNITLTGELTIPLNAATVIIFPEGDSSYNSGTLFLSRFLNRHNIGTLVIDLLTPEEDNHYLNRFDIELLTKRLIGVTVWLLEQTEAINCSLGYFGTGTNAAAALKAASYLPQVSAVVCAGGRPDLVMDNLPNVESPVLLVAARLDYEVLRLNKEAYIQLNCDKRLHIVEGATHLLEEKDTANRVAELAADWFEKYLQPVKV